MKKRLFIVFFMFIGSILKIFAQTAEIQGGGQFRIMGYKDNVVDKIMSPAENTRFVAFDIIIDNTNGTRKIQLNLLAGNIEVRDTEGYSYEPLLTSYDAVEPAMSTNAEVEQGELLRGWMTIQIHKDSPIAGIRIRIKSITNQSDWVTVDGEQ